MSIYLLFSAAASFAQFSAPKYGNEFLAIGVGARALGMSNAQTASVNDVTAGFWNPAGLIHVKDTFELSLMHAEYFAGIAKYDYLSFTTKIDSNSSLGVSAIRFGVDDIPDTRFLFDANGVLNYDNIKFFSASDYAFLFSYARRSARNDSLFYGGNFKIIYRNAGNFANAWGFGIDVGAQYWLPSMKLGAVLKDGPGTYTTWFVNSALLEDVFVLTDNVIPGNSVEVTLPRLTLGACKSFKIGQKFGVLTALDLVNTFDGKRNVLIKSNTISVDPRLGVEADFRKVVFLRIGAGGFQQSKDFNGEMSWQWQPNFGIGVKLKSFTLDYALTDAINASDALFSNVFSIKFGFNK